MEQLTPKNPSMAKRERISVKDHFHRTDDKMNFLLEKIFEAALALEKFDGSNDVEALEKRRDLIFSESSQPLTVERPFSKLENDLENREAKLNQAISLMEDFTTKLIDVLL